MTRGSGAGASDEPAIAPTWDALSADAAARGLWAIGGLHPGPDDAAPQGTGTLVLLAPLEPGFWPRVTAEPEFSDGRRDPLDRWSRRVIGRLACDLGAKALFPFAGPPWRPFLKWAERSGQFHPSPLGMLVHPEAGLWASLRGALALKARIDVPPPRPSPCDTCADRPCRTACPVGALGGVQGYDIAACHGYLDQLAGIDCLSRGCAARRACPVSQSHPRLEAQSAFHMASFHPRS